MMKLARRYQPSEVEPRVQAFWTQIAAYHFSRDNDSRPVYAIDTPPATVSGHLHLGHVYSYSHTDFIARYRRMRGDNVFYPMGFDDNGLPTERLVEKWEGIRAIDVGREAFIERCLAVSSKAEEAYRLLWTRLGLSIDWNYTYRTIDELSRRTSQASFLDLYRKGLAYRKVAPAIWCPECRTAIAQAELADLDRESVFYTLAFGLEDAGTLKIATTRPELLPACVAIFVHPDDPRYRSWVGHKAQVPYSGQWVPILDDPAAEPEKGTGAVMCCTFGDVTDVMWWRLHDLPLRLAIDAEGRMTEIAGDLQGLPVPDARARIVHALDEKGLLLARQAISQSVRVHERCDTPVEYIVTPQWFVRVLEHKDELLAAGERVSWHPEHMGVRYREWVENLSWDWCISRQRYFGVTFPVWFCKACGSILLANESELPVDPTTRGPGRACPCGGTEFEPETDVMDTWATSSLSPQIVGRWLSDPELYAKVTPFTLRPQAHEIIRTWAFYTIAKSLFHFGTTPWHDAAISGWGLAPEGTGKISKSKGGGPVSPLDMIEAYSADAVRYWSSSTGFGKDSVINEEKIQAGDKLVTKLWNVANFSARFLAASDGSDRAPEAMTPADRWILSRTARLVHDCTVSFEAYDYATAKSMIEGFFWHDFADNYLEMAKLRLYEAGEATESGDPRWVLRTILKTVLTLFAPFLPHVTEEIWQHLFAAAPWVTSIHNEAWPVLPEAWISDGAERLGQLLVEIATAVRRYKSIHALALGTEIDALVLSPSSDEVASGLRAAEHDLRSVTRARQVRVQRDIPQDATEVLAQDGLRAAVVRGRSET